MFTGISTLSRTLCAGGIAVCGLASLAHAQVVIHTVRPVHPAHPVKTRRGAPVHSPRPVVVRGAPVVPKIHPPHAVIAASTAGERPHLRAALAALQAASQSMGSAATLGQLRSAFAELNASAASDVYHSHRYDAIQCTRRAIKVLKENASAADVASLTNEAIGHVQFCLAAPVK